MVVRGIIRPIGGRESFAGGIGELACVYICPCWGLKKLPHHFSVLKLVIGYRLSLKS
jgi:hypothetical protein